MGLEQVAGTGAVITIGSTTYRLARLGVGAFAEIMAEIKRRRWLAVKDAAAACRDMPPELAREFLGPLVDTAKQPVKLPGDGDDAAGDEYASFMESPDGACYMFWMLVRVGHPEISSISKARALLDELNAADIKKLANDILESSGLTELEQAVKN